MPSFVPSFGRGSEQRRSSPPPQPTYVKRLVQGELQDVQLCQSPHQVKRRQTSAAQKAGLAYQRKVERWAYSGGWLGQIRIGPWFSYQDQAGRGYCQPDLLLDESRCDPLVICEVKLRWHSDAWWQLERLYRPVLQWIYPGRELLSLCICKSFDPAAGQPGKTELVRSIKDCKASQVSVLILP